MNKPLKVLHLFDLYLPQTMNWAYRAMLATPGAECWVAAPWIVQNTYFHPDFRFFIRPLQAWRPLPATEWTTRRLATGLVRSEKYWPLYRRWLQAKLRRARPDVLHAHFGPVGCHYLPLARQLQLPLVTSFYGYDYESLPFRKPAYLEQYRQLFQDAAAVTAMGPHGRQVLLEQGCPAEKAYVQPLGIIPAEFPFIPRQKTVGRLRLVQVATITEKKGFLDTFQALQIIRERCPRVQLTIAGEPFSPALVRQMQDYLRQQDLSEHVSWLESVPHAQLAEFLSRFDVFIHPSHYTASRDCEGGPVVVLEAQATGLPVIATTHFDLPAEVLHGQTGLLAPERDPPALARHIERFYRMENEEYQGFSRAARRHVEAHFDVKNSAAALSNLYQKVIRSADLAG